MCWRDGGVTSGASGLTAADIQLQLPESIGVLCLYANMNDCTYAVDGDEKLRVAFHEAISRASKISKQNQEVEAVTKRKREKQTSTWKEKSTAAAAKGSKKP